MNRKLCLFIITILVTTLRPGLAHATCTGPAGTESQVIYNKTYHRAQYCNGTGWIEFPYATGGGTGCTSPAGIEGALIYNQDYHVLEYCNGTSWVGAAKSAIDTLTGSYTSASSNVSLSGVGTSDWAKWPSYIHSSSGGSQISNLTNTGTSATYTNDVRGFSWTGGTPTASGSGVTTGVFVVGGCYFFTAPATTTSHVLYIYVSVYQTRGIMIASLSDVSTPAAAYYVDTSASSGTTTYGYYTFIYKAASANKTIKIQWCPTAQDGSGNVTIVGAALQ